MLSVADAATAAALQRSKNKAPSVCARPKEISSQFAGASWRDTARASLF
jgi:hypothetical protein